MLPSLRQVRDVDGMLESARNDIIICSGLSLLRKDLANYSEENIVCRESFGSNYVEPLGTIA